MMQHRLSLALSKRHLHRIQHGTQVLGHLPTNDPAAEYIHDRRQTQKSFPFGCRGVEVPIHQVRCDSIKGIAYCEGDPFATTQHGSAERQRSLAKFYQSLQYAGSAAHPRSIRVVFQARHTRSIGSIRSPLGEDRTKSVEPDDVKMRGTPGMGKVTQNDSQRITGSRFLPPTRKRGREDGILGQLL